MQEVINAKRFSIPKQANAYTFNVILGRVFDP